MRATIAMTTPDWGALLVLAMPVACIAWTVTHEELFREPREWLAHRRETSSSVLAQKFYYVFSCEYCFSHWVAILALIVFRFKMIYEDGRGYILAGFCLVWIANVYMGLFARLRLDIRKERVDLAAKEAALPGAE